MTDPREQVEKETKAICRGFLKAVYSGFSENYLPFYPELEFLKILSLENLQYLDNLSSRNNDSQSKNHYIYRFLSQQINELRYEIVIDNHLSEYKRRMMKNDAKYYAELSVDENNRYNIDKKYHRERELLIQCFYNLQEKNKNQ